MTEFGLTQFISLIRRSYSVVRKLCCYWQWTLFLFPVPIPHVVCVLSPFILSSSSMFYRFIVFGVKNSFRVFWLKILAPVKVLILSLGGWLIEDFIYVCYFTYTDKEEDSRECKTPTKAMEFVLEKRALIFYRLSAIKCYPKTRCLPIFVDIAMISNLLAIYDDLFLPCNFISLLSNLPRFNFPACLWFAIHG